MQMSISQNGVDNLVKKFEGCRLEAYQDVKGVWTIGWGHTSDVHKGMQITQAQADAMLLSDLAGFASKVAELVKVPLNTNQFDALTSFCYNVGVSAFAKSTLCQMINASNFADAAKEFDKWINSGGKVYPGLVNRRNAEQALFLTPVPVPKPVAKPAPKPTPKPVAKVAPKPAVKPVVKKPAPAPTTYKVVKGDTLSGIALKQHTTVDALKTLNHLKTDVIKTGQSLRLK